MNNSIFTHALYRCYESPPGFYFDVNDNDEVITEKNIKNKSDIFVAYFKEMAQYYDQNILMHTMGGDFQFANAS